MMTRTALFACLLWLGASQSATALDAVTAADTARFRALEDELWTAWNAHLNPAEAAPYYSSKPGNLYFDLSPLKFVGWAEYQRVASQALAGGGSAKTFIHDDFTVIKQGDLVVTAFTFDVEFARPPAATSKMTARETDVWTREHGRWVIVHQHMSVPLSVPEPK